jgi:hypothetical protein
VRLLRKRLESRFVMRFSCCRGMLAYFLTSVTLIRIKIEQILQIAECGSDLRSADCDNLFCCHLVTAYGVLSLRRCCDSGPDSWKLPKLFGLL